MRRGRAWLLVGAVAWSAVLVACGSSPGSKAGSKDGGAGVPAISIGVAVARTSNIALAGQEQVTGAQLAEQLLNQRGGVDGRPIRLVLQDTGGDEAGARNAFDVLIAAGVVAIVGPTLSQQAFAADPLAERHRVPVVAPSNTAPGIPQIGDYITRVSAPVTVVAPLAVEQALAVDRNIRKAAVAFAQNDTFASSETKIFQETLRSKGLEVTTVQTFQSTDTDFTTQINAVVGKRPELVVVSGLVTDGGNFVKQLREIGYQGVIVGGNGFNTANVFPVCGRACDGVIVAQAYNPSVENDINAAFRQAHIEAQRKEPGQFTAQAFTAVQVVVEALESVGSTHDLSQLELAELRTALNEAILAGRYETPLGPVSFTPEGEINQADFYVARITTDGQTGSFARLR